MINIEGPPLKLLVFVRFRRAIAVTMALSLASWAASLPNPPLNVWYTQIGQWHIQPKNNLYEKSVIFHDSRIDGARSGQATANVRLNFAFQGIRLCEARLALGPAPALAGLLVQNKQVTYYFFVLKGTTSDTIRIFRNSNGRLVSIFSEVAKILDTTRITLNINADSLYFGVDGKSVRIIKPQDFSSLTTVGFECVLGSVKVFEVQIEARNSTIKETFDKTRLINLHLDKILSCNVKRTTIFVGQHRAFRSVNPKGILVFAK